MNWYYFFGAWVALIVLIVVANHKKWFRVVPKYRDLQNSVRTGGSMGVTNGEENERKV